MKVSNVPEPSARIALSFGAGVQTSALLALALADEMERPHVVIFADTLAEWPETYEYLNQVVKPRCLEADLPFETVSKDDLYEFFWHYRILPSPMMRSCTHRFKIRPLHKAYREHEVGVEWIGFSLEEQGRASRRQSRVEKFLVRFPLIEIGLTRSDCEAALVRLGWPVPRKSSCIFCPFQHPSQVRLLGELHPELFEKVGRLEDRALGRSPGWYIYHRPWRSYADGQLAFEDWDYGCGEGYCFR